MAYTPVPTKYTGNTITADDWNVYVVDNFAASVPDLFQAAGDLAVGLGSANGGRLPIGAYDTYLRANPAAAFGLEWQAIPKAAIRNSGSQQVYPASNTLIDFNTVEANRDGLMGVDLVNNLVTVPRAGVYAVTYSLDVSRGVPYDTNDFPTLGYYIALYLTGTTTELLQMWVRDNEPPKWNSLHWSGAVSVNLPQYGSVALLMFLNRSGYLGPVTVLNARLSVALAQ